MVTIHHEKYDDYKGGRMETPDELKLQFPIAKKLLVEYGSLDFIYENIDSIKGSVHDKLVNDKENDYKSYELVTIVIILQKTVNWRYRYEYNNKR